jgi:hypothetical protein
MRILAVLVASTLLLAAAPVRAQQMIPPGAFRIGPYPVACQQSVTILTGPQLGDVARATFGQIYINAPVFFQLPIPVQMFVYAHECAHAIGIVNESQADCFAIQLGRQQGWVNPMTFPQMCASVMNSAGDWTHLPGPQRCQLMMMCFNN